MQTSSRKLLVVLIGVVLAGFVFYQSRGFIHRANFSGEKLLQAVRVVARGDALLAPSVTRSLIAAFAARPAAQADAPPRDRLMFQALGQIYLDRKRTATRVARDLAVSRRTLYRLLERGVSAVAVQLSTTRPPDL